MHGGYWAANEWLSGWQVMGRVDFDGGNNTAGAVASTVASGSTTIDDHGRVGLTM